MPQFLQPKQSTQHRVAAIALYRALLSQCSSAPLPDDDRASLRHAIRNKFRKNRKIQSPYQLGLSFKAGYEILDHLDASTSGDTASTSTLKHLISKLPRGLTRMSISKPITPTPSIPKQRLACLPKERAVLNVRPYAHTSGPRHVPMIASANGIPFLRLTKPQPPALSRILRQRLDYKQNLFDDRVLLSNWWWPMARQEDEWDAIVDKQAGGTLDNDDGGVRWVDAVDFSNRENQDAYEKDQDRDSELRRKMQTIVDEEMRLALEEGQTIVRGRKRKPIKIIRPDT